MVWFVGHVAQLGRATITGVSDAGSIPAMSIFSYKLSRQQKCATLSWCVRVVTRETGSV